MPKTKLRYILRAIKNQYFIGNLLRENENEKEKGKDTIIFSYSSTSQQKKNHALDPLSNRRKFASKLCIII